jgi:hypothetical protein
MGILTLRYEQTAQPAEPGAPPHRTAFKLSDNSFEDTRM